MPKLQIFLDPDSPITHEIAVEKTTIGRVADNDLQIEDASVSSHHAEIFERDGVFFLKDLGSTNGSEINGKPATESPLKPGDQIRFGNVPALFLEEGLIEEVQSIPDAPSGEAEGTGGSSRPANFVNSSPFPKSEPVGKGVSTAAFALAALAILAFALLAFSVASLTLPTFPAP
jgi:pSer/pThr/pTyr-binding forkhead associated (FHA) protein